MKEDEYSKFIKEQNEISRIEKHLKDEEKKLTRRKKRFRFWRK